MSPLQILFIFTAAVTLGAAIMVVSTRNLIHAALWLVVSLFGVAVFFVLLNAGFLAVAQVVIYIGAIAILMIFAIMLTKRVAEDRGSQFNSKWGMSAVFTIVLFAGLVWMLGNWRGFSTPIPELSPGADPLRQLGLALVSLDAYIVPFEVASVLLLAALIGAIMVAWDKTG